MTRFDEQDPWALLGVSPGATVDEIRRAYEKLHAALAPGSLALYSVADAEEQRRLQRALQVAYLRLLRLAGADAPPEETKVDAAPQAPPSPSLLSPSPTPSPPAPPAPPLPVIEAGTNITGQLLRQVRESKRLSLDEVARHTRIRKVHIESLEREDFSSLPERVFTRGFVFTYACELGLDPIRAWACIEPRYLAAHPPQELRLPS